MADAVRVVMPDAGCRGIDLDGRHYDAHDGAVRVEGPRAAQLRRVADTLPGFIATFHRAPGVTCTACGRAQFAWSGTACGRCGGRCA